MDKPVLPRIYLSPPHMSGEELELVKDTFARSLAGNGSEHCRPARRAHMKNVAWAASHLSKKIGS